MNEAIAGKPAVAGWLAHITAPTDHGPATCSACRVRPAVDDAANKRNVADCTTQPSGMPSGIAKRIRARRFDPTFDITLRVESLPLLSSGLPSSIHASASAAYDAVAPHWTGAGGGAAT